METQLFKIILLICRNQLILSEIFTPSYIVVLRFVILSKQYLVFTKVTHSRNIKNKYIFGIKTYYPITLSLV